MVNPFYKKVKKKIALRGKIPNATRSSKKYDDTNTMEQEKQVTKYGASKSKDLCHTLTEAQLPKVTRQTYKG
jgi:hypothetical protein